jgi:hypothetical protein
MVCKSGLFHRWTDRTKPPRSAAARFIVSFAQSYTQDLCTLIGL